MKILTPFCKSWADEVEDLDSVLRLVDAGIDLGIQEEEFSFVRGSGLESVYIQWASSDDRTLYNNIHNYTFCLCADIRDAMDRVFEELATVKLNFRKKIYRQPQVSNEEYFTVYNEHQVVISDLFTSFNKLQVTAKTMFMFPTSSTPVPDYGVFEEMETSSLLNFASGISKNKKRKHEAKLLLDSCRDTVYNFYKEVNGILRDYRFDFDHLHRRLILFKIKFEKENPEVTTLVQSHRKMVESFVGNFHVF